MNEVHLSQALTKATWVTPSGTTHIDMTTRVQGKATATSFPTVDLMAALDPSGLGAHLLNACVYAYTKRVGGADALVNDSATSADALQTKVFSQLKAHMVSQTVQNALLDSILQVGGPDMPSFTPGDVSVKVYPSAFIDLIMKFQLAVLDFQLKAFGRVRALQIKAMPFAIRLTTMYQQFPPSSLYSSPTIPDINGTTVTYVLSSYDTETGANQANAAFALDSSAQSGCKSTSVFDGSGYYKGAALTNASSGWFVQVTLPTTVLVTQYILGGGQADRDTAPSNLQLFGSNDGSNWVLLDSQTSQTYSPLDTKLTLASDVPFLRTFRLVVSKTSNASGVAKSVEVVRLRLLGIR
jgi:hypothetical protein